MEQMKKVLEKLEHANMHVHVIDHDDGYKGFKAPIAHLVASTHFIMHEDDIVHVGDIETIKRFALNL